MKQHIIKEQWHELDKKEKKVILDWLLKEDLGLTYLNTRWGDKYSFNIGIMIGFLEGNVVINIDDEIGNWCVHFDNNFYRDTELCNCLWEAIKYKLKK